MAAAFIGVGALIGCLIVAFDPHPSGTGGYVAAGFMGGFAGAVLGAVVSLLTQ